MVAKVRNNFLISKKIRKNLLFFLFYLYYSSILEGFAIHRLNCFLAKRNPNFVLPLESFFLHTAEEKEYNRFHTFHLENYMR